MSLYWLKIVTRSHTATVLGSFQTTTNLKGAIVNRDTILTLSRSYWECRILLAAPASCLARPATRSSA